MIDPEKLKELLAEIDASPWTVKFDNGVTRLVNSANQTLMHDEEYYPCVSLSISEFEICALAPALAARVLELEEKLRAPNPTDEMTRVYTVKHALQEQYGQFYEEAVEAESEFGGAAIALIPEPEVQAYVTALLAKIEAAREALDCLSKLGNGERDGNSDGNKIAQAARAKLEEDDA